jgi:AcrR family transcriptional regulator
MRRVQEAALGLFERHGFDAVSIESIADAAEVGPATVYRNFGTKERIVLWDEYDPLLLEAIGAELVEHPVLEAVPRGVTSRLAEIYATDRARILRRARIIRATPTLLQVAAGDARQLRAALAEVLRRSKRATDGFEAMIFAGAIVAALEVALDRWLDADGETSLGRCFTLAFKRLGRLSES